MTNNPSVALIGAGAMGGALLRGWLSAGSIDPASSAVFDPGVSPEITALCTEQGGRINPAIEGRFDAIIIAVKPQAANVVLPAYSGIANNAVVVSVMAGKTIASIAEALGGAAKIARVMPNLPAAIGRGVSGLFAPESINQDGRALIEILMAAAGETVWVETEEQIDFVTAVSGSGPAYYFLLTEALAQAGESLGLAPDAAAKLARATLSGAGALMEIETRSPAEMRRAVTSPGGTTEAALNILDGDNEEMRKLIKSAVKAAAQRGAALAG